MLATLQTAFHFAATGSQTGCGLLVSAHPDTDIYIGLTGVFGADWDEITRGVIVSGWDFAEVDEWGLPVVSTTLADGRQVYALRPESVSCEPLEGAAFQRWVDGLETLAAKSGLLWAA